MLQKISSSMIFVSMYVFLGCVDGKKHVHFKIHVPEIIKHHFHTKTIFLHIHPLPKEPPKEPPKKEPPKKKPSHYEESSYEDWSSFSSYNDDGNHEEVGENGDVIKEGYENQKCVKGNNYQKNNYDSYLPSSHGAADAAYNEVPQANYNSAPQSNHNYNPNLNYRANPNQNFNQNYNPNTHYGPNSNYVRYPNNGPNQNFGRNPNYAPNQNYGINPNFNPNYQVNYAHPQYNNGQEMVGYMYPPQYAIHEDVDDIPNNDVEQLDVYEDGYKRGLESETGHLITKNLKDFYDDKFDEAGDFAEEGEEKDYEKRKSDSYQANYDKEIGHRDRSSNKNGQRRIFSPKIVIR